MPLSERMRMLGDLVPMRISGLKTKIEEATKDLEALPEQERAEAIEAIRHVDYLLYASLRFVFYGTRSS